MEREEVRKAVGGALKFLRRLEGENPIEPLPPQLLCGHVIKRRGAG